MKSLTSTKRYATAATLTIALALGLAASSNGRYDHPANASPANSATMRESCAAMCLLPAPTSDITKLSEKELAYIFYNRGIAYESADNQPAAIRHFKAAYRLLPTHVTIQAKMKNLGLL